MTIKYDYCIRNVFIIRTVFEKDNCFLEIYPCCESKYPIDKISLEDFLKKSEFEYSTKNYIKINNSLWGSVSCIKCDLSKRDSSKENLCVSVIEGTHTCNLNCIMCGLPHEPQHKLEKETYFKILYKLKDLNTPIIGLTEVGEPFFYKKETFNFLKSLIGSKTKSVRIVSNISLLSETDIKILKSIKDAGLDIRITASIDGISKETYNNIRINSSFDKVFKNLNLLNEFKLVNYCNYVLQKSNYHEYNDIKPFFKEKGINVNIIYRLDEIDFLKEHCRNFVLDTNTN